MKLYLKLAIQLKYNGKYKSRSSSKYTIADNRSGCLLIWTEAREACYSIGLLQVIKVIVNGLTEHKD